MSQQQQGITDSQLFQQFTKSSQLCASTFQLLFDTSMQLASENGTLKKLLKANNIKIPTQPLPEGTIIAEVKEPNRQERRKAEKIAKKQAKKLK